MNIVVHFCDRCSASIPEKDVADKAAFIQGGLTLCSTCRRALGGASGDPEIFFCEGCGRSISVPELEVGSVSVVSGRLLCAGCRPSSDVGLAVAGAPAQSSAPPARRTRSVGGGLAVAGLLAAGAAGIALFVPTVREALESRGYVSKRAAARQDSSESTLPPAVLATKEDLIDLAASVDRLAAVVGALADDGAEADASARWEGLEARLLEAARSDSSALAALEDSIEDVRGLIGELRGELDAVRTLASVASEGEAVRGDDSATQNGETIESEPAQAPVPPSPVSSSPGRDQWIADLADSDSGKRFTAIVELARLRDPSAISELGKTVTSDPDIYCRTEAGRTLGEFRDHAAIPHLIAALRDREVMVALTAAEALTTITSKSFGFTNKDTPQERREAISRWESWWEKNKDTLDGGGGSKH